MQEVGRDGSELGDGWLKVTRRRNSGVKAQSIDKFYVSPDGQRFNSRVKVDRFMAGDLSASLSRRNVKPCARKVNAADREKRTALHWASGKNALPCVAALIDAGADVNARDWAEHTPMHWACPMDAIESVKVLAAAGADLNAVDRDRRTPLHWAAEKGAEGCLAFLLEQSGVTVDAVDWGGYSPLHSASRRGSVGCINLLLAKGANADLAALSGETPAEVAGSAEAKSLLASKGSASPGIKRKRSSGSIALEGSLPELADALYSAIAKKGAKEVYTSLCDEATGAALAKWAASVMKAGLTVGTKHVSTKTASVHTELTLGDRGKTKLLHQLTFDEDGLIVGSVVYTAAK